MEQPGSGKSLEIPPEQAQSCCSDVACRQFLQTVPEKVDEKEEIRCVLTPGEEVPIGLQTVLRLFQSQGPKILQGPVPQFMLIPEEESLFIICVVF